MTGKKTGFQAAEKRKQKFLEKNRKKVLTNPVSFGILIERLTKGKCFQGDEPLAPHIDLAVQMKKSEKKHLTNERARGIINEFASLT